MIQAHTQRHQREVFAFANGFLQIIVVSEVKKGT